MQPILDRFSAVWYGDAPAGAEEWRETAEHAAHIEAMAAEQASVARQQGHAARSAA